MQAYNGPEFRLKYSVLWNVLRDRLGQQQISDFDSTGILANRVTYKMH